jgi:hypothetical protein
MRLLATWLELPFAKWRNMADKYASFQELERAERRGVYRVLSRPRKATIAVIAPHGGKIEPGTSEIARKIAGADFSFYAFEGRKKRHNKSLHITSTRFDEPICLALIGGADCILTGPYFLRYSLSDGTRPWESVGDDLDSAIDAQKRKQAYFESLDANLPVIQDQDESGQTEITDAVFQGSPSFSYFRAKTNRARAKRLYERKREGN